MTEPGLADEPPLAEWAGRPIWLPWKWVQRASRRTKAPLRLLGGKALPARVEDAPTTLGQAEDAAGADAVPPGERGGVGLALGVGLGRDGEVLIALDLDAARDPETGAVAPWAQSILARFPDTYADISPSGSGIHILLRATADDFLAIKGLIGGKQRVEWKRLAAAPGAKAPGFELLLGGFITVTRDLLPGAARTISTAPLDAIHWLVNEAGPAFAPRPPPAQKKRRQVDVAAPPPVEHLHEPDPRRFIASARRLQRWARDMSDACFQVAAAFATATKKGATLDRRRAALARDRLLALPGRDANSRRSNPTVTATLAQLVAQHGFKVTSPPIRPHAGQPGRATEYDFPAWWVSPQSRAPPPRVQLLRAEWERAVWSMPPFALRVWCYILATHALDGADPDAPFTPRIGELAETFGGKRDRITAALDAIAAAGLFEVVTSRRPGRAATFRRPARP